MSPARRTVVVYKQDEVASGHGDRGDWVLYAVEATTAEGEMIAEQLRSFEILPTGEPLEVDVEERNSSKYGQTFTLKPVREPDKSGKRASRLDALERQFNEMGARLDDLSDRLAKVEAAVGRILKALKEQT